MSSEGRRTEFKVVEVATIHLLRGDGLGLAAF
jgi:hypothetical protein